MSKRNNRYQLIVSFLLSTVMTYAGFAQEVTPDPKSIIERMINQYATASSYKDSGVVDATITEGSEIVTEKIEFKTHFKRPKFFRFEWLTSYSFLPDTDRKVIWSNGKYAYSFWEPDSFEREKDLSMAVAGATGITQGSANTISSMLMEDVGVLKIWVLEYLTLVGTEILDGDECYVVTGNFLSNTSRIWIGKKDYLLRKITERYKIGSSTTVEVVECHKDINLNQPLPSDVFNFKPPISQKRK